MAAYDQAGGQPCYEVDGAPNNIELRYGFPIGGGPVDLVVASNALTDGCRASRVEPATRGLVDVAARPLGVGLVAAKRMRRAAVNATDWCQANTGPGSRWDGRRRHSRFEPVPWDTPGRGAPSRRQPGPNRPCTPGKDEGHWVLESTDGRGIGVGKGPRQC